MGAGILPATIHKGQLYFLFGKENKYADTPGWSDIGGGTDNGESFLETASREATEEMTGFLGDEKNVRSLLRRHGTYNIQWDSPGHKPYRMHIFAMEYDENLPTYYNNNHKFIERKLSETLIKQSKIFEKDELKWVSLDELVRMHKQKKFRSYFQEIAMQIFNERHKIKRFISVSLKKGTTRKAPRKTRKTRKH